MSTRDEKVRADLEVLRTGEMGALRFVIPEEIKALVSRDSSLVYHANKQLPGIYTRSWGQHVSPRLLDFSDRRLSREEAIEYARMLDRLFSPRPHGGTLSRSEHRPSSFEGLVTRWYEALGRFLHIAQETAEKRASDLRTVRAAITGEVDDEEPKTPDDFPF